MERFRGLAVAGTCLLLVVGGARMAARPAHAPGAARWPSAEEMDSLQRYLAPVAEAPSLDDYDMYLPAEAPLPAPVVEAGPAPAADQLRLSAILISGDNLLAIIDDRPVRPGAHLPGGAQVVRIASDHVVIREPGGALRTLRLTTGEEGPNEE